MSLSQSTSLTIRHAKQADRDVTHAFHRAHVGEHLWGRSMDDFQALVDESNLFIVRSTDQVHGLCYVVLAGREWEFGGVYLDETLRGRGVAAALARTAIASLYIQVSPQSLIAHVHEKNELPRGLLGCLGFEGTGRQIIAPPDSPATMERNEEGQVVGDVFQFRPFVLAEFADWFEGYTGVMGRGGSEPVKVDIDAAIWHKREKWLPALREMAKQDFRR